MAMYPLDLQKIRVLVSMEGRETLEFHELCDDFLKEDI